MAEADVDSPPLDFTSYNFAGLLPTAFEDVILSNTERLQLRGLAEKGGPLWRIMQGLLGYRETLGRALAICDLYSETGLAQARSLQNEMKAIGWQYDMWVRQLTFQPHEDQGS